MNWNRAKSIFIVVFLILNLFLGYQLWEKQAKNIELVQIYESSLEEQLSLKQIDIETELEVEQPQLPQLSAQFLPYPDEDFIQIEDQTIAYDFNEEQYQLTIELDTPYTLSNNEDGGVAEFARGFINDYVIYADEYAYDRRTRGEVVYLQQAKGHPIFGGTLTLLVERSNESTELVGYEQFYYHITTQGTEQPIISAYVALRTLLDNQMIPSYSSIEDVTLGYHSVLYEAESQVLTPSWRVMIEHREEQLTFYVNGITGAIESEPVRDDTIEPESNGEG